MQDTFSQSLYRRHQRLTKRLNPFVKTKAQGIDEMTAGRELDALIAEMMKVNDRDEREYVINRQATN